MNEKKSKRLRQLIKHLMSNGAIAPSGWRAYSSSGRNAGTKTLDPACGRAIYRTMKKRNLLQHHPFSRKQ